MPQDVRDFQFSDKPLVASVSGEGSAFAFNANDYELDITFMPQNSWLEHPPVDQAEKALRSLLGQISRNKHDIYSMVKRIYFLRALNDKENLSSAIYDLFECLKERGKPLKQRILRSTQNYLTTDELEFLKLSMDKPMPISIPKSMLHSSASHLGMWGETNIVTKTNEQQQNEISALDQAREHINQGNIAAAVNILEALLQKTPEDNVIADELFLIYQHTHDATAIQRMIDVLSKDNPSYLDAWKRLAEKLRRDTETP